MVYFCFKNENSKIEYLFKKPESTDLYEWNGEKTDVKITDDWKIVVHKNGVVVRFDLTEKGFIPQKMRGIEEMYERALSNVKNESDSGIKVETKSQENHLSLKQVPPPKKTFETEGNEIVLNWAKQKHVSNEKTESETQKKHVLSEETESVGKSKFYSIMPKHIRDIVDEIDEFEKNGGMIKF